MTPGDKIGTWENDGSPLGKFQWSPGYGPRAEFWRGVRLLVVLVVVVWMLVILMRGM